MKRKTDGSVRIGDITSIFDCAEYMEHGTPPYHDNYDIMLRENLPVVFSFAYTPGGRVSKYWCSLAFRHPTPSVMEIEEWMASRPRLRKGYKWSKPYWYMRASVWEQ